MSAHDCSHVASALTGVHTSRYRRFNVSVLLDGTKDERPHHVVLVLRGGDGDVVLGKERYLESARKTVTISQSIS